MKKISFILQTLLASTVAAVMVIGWNHFSPEEAAQSPIQMAISNNHFQQNDSVVPENKADHHAVLAGNFPSTMNQLVDLSPAAETTIHGVVHVTNKSLIEQKAYAYNPFQHFFYGQPYQELKQYKEAISSGSGVIISDDGYIVTNNHVVKNAQEITIAMNDQTVHKARVVGTDPSTDIALLKIDGEGFSFLPFGKPDDVKIGQWVLAVGNPFNLKSTVTAGIVSAIGRDIDILKSDPNTGLPPIESFIQTDAAVNPGNSGGALVNARGELIGINTAIKSNTGSYTGYSFAVPISIVKKVVADLLEFGTVQRAFLGAQLSEINPSINNQDKTGMYVNHIVPNGAAAQGGVKTGDIILKIQDQPIKNLAGFQEIMSGYRPGDEVHIQVDRDGELMYLKLKLKNQYGNDEISTRSNKNCAEIMGAQIKEPSAKVLNQLEINGGAQISKIRKGKLHSAGIKEGFIITSLNHKPVTSLTDFTDLIKDVKGGVLIEGIYPSGAKGYYAFGL